MKAHWNRDDPASVFIPYSAHITESIVSMTNGTMVATVLSLEGLAHESADPQDIDNLHDALNGAWRNIAGPDIAVWTHIIRREKGGYPNGHQPSGFAQSFDVKYRESISRKKMLGNDLYLTLVVKANAGDRLRKKGGENIQERLKVRCDDLCRNLMVSLTKYGPRRLGLYESGGQVFSEPLELFGFLVNGHDQKVLAPRRRIADALCSTRNVFHKDLVEQRFVSGIQYQGMVTIKEYPDGTETGMLNAILSCPFEVVVSQSFAFLSKEAAVDKLKKAKRRMENAEDDAQSQIDEIKDAIDDAASGRVALGDHYLSIAVKAPSAPMVEDYISEVWGEVVNAAPGTIMTREDLALEAAFWAQLPGNLKWRPRPASISSRNFVGFSSFHNYPMGRETGNQWGPAVMVVRTAAGSPYYLNLHLPVREESRVADPNAGSQQRVVGNALICGPTGSGKTVLAGTILTQAEKFGGPRVIWDRDRGLEILVRALGGTYFPLKAGHPTGFNPFARPDTPEWRQFLYRLVKKLVSDTSIEVTVDRERQLVEAVDRVMGELTPEYRRIRSVQQLLTDHELIDALNRWVGDGEFGWVFDNPSDELDLSNGRMFGFDVTEFLRVDEIRTPVVMYVMERIEALINGSRFMMLMDEFAALLRDPIFVKPVQLLLETIRKRNGLLLLLCQSPTQVVKSSIADGVLEQVKTQGFFPNPSANKEHLQKFGFSQREIDIITGPNDMQEGSGRFLWKQNNASVIGELDLTGFDDELAVISGTTENVEVLESAMAEAESTGVDWLPIFHAWRNEGDSHEEDDLSDVAYK